MTPLWLTMSAVGILSLALATHDAAISQNAAVDLATIDSSDSKPSGLRRSFKYPGHCASI